VGACKYCGKPAGIFHSEHRECAEAHDAKLRIAQEQRSERLRKAQQDLLQSIAAGDPPSWPGPVPPINLVGGESVVWVFQDIQYLRDKQKRTYSGVYGGPSVHLFRGVSVRVGAFHGAPATSVSRISMGTGSLILTTERIYFYGETTSLRVQYKKIASFLPFSDGVGIIQDSANALPHIFVTGSDFAFDMLTSIAHLAANPVQKKPEDTSSSKFAVTSELNDPELDEAVYQNAVNVVVSTQRATASGLMRHLRISYPMALQLLDLMEGNGIVSALASDGTRQVLRTAGGSAS
jgi:hypothetical protein